jgi:hypothetical protein
MFVYDDRIVYIGLLCTFVVIWKSLSFGDEPNVTVGEFGQ